MKSEIRMKVLASAAALMMSVLATYAVARDPSNKLAAPESFATIADADMRSAAIFTELGKVLTHPRCVNCHPAGDRPHQGDRMRLHQPPLSADRTVMACQPCVVQLAIRMRTLNRGAFRDTRNGTSRRAKWHGKARPLRRSASR